VTTTDPLPDIFDLQADDPLGEALLLQAVRDGSTAAFGILYARYRSFAVGIAMRALSGADMATAEDVVEVSFIRVLTALRNGKGPTDTLRAYLTTTVRREVWRAQRRIRRQAEVVDRWASDEDRGETDISPLPVDTSDLASHALLSEAFRGLSERWRHVLWLTEVEGRKPAEVAPMLGVSAGSASALAYRARNGLVTAYIAAYRRRTDDEDCLAITGRLGEYVAAGSPAEGFADVLAHLEGCVACRDVSRGVDVLGSVLASFAPFGLLTAGLWAQTAGVGAAGLAGAAAAAGVATHAVGGSATAGTAATAGTGTAAGGVSLAGGIAAAAAVAVVAGATWFGLVRSDAQQDAGRPAASATTEAEVPAAPVPSNFPPGPATTAAQRAEISVSSAQVDAPTSTSAAPAATTTTADDAPATASVPLPPSATPTVPVTTTIPDGPTPSAPSSSTTTIVEPPAGDGMLTGRVLRAPNEQSAAGFPVSGVDVVAYDDAGQLAAAGTSAPDGRWHLGALKPGHYVVVAVVPAQYRLASGEDPWTGGTTWATILGSVDLAQTPIDLVDLRLVTR
jgi:RNA polymerase sigma factor (sigma-70 family)